MSDVVSIWCPVVGPTGELTVVMPSGGILIGASLQLINTSLVNGEVATGYVSLATQSGGLGLGSPILAICSGIVNAAVGGAYQFSVNVYQPLFQVVQANQTVIVGIIGAATATHYCILQLAKDSAPPRKARTV